MEDTKYNGWANYATWRVQLEIVDGYVSTIVYDDDWMRAYWLDSSLSDIADELHEYVEEVIFMEQEDKESIADSYARAFLDTVDWREIAEHAKEQAEEADKFVNA